MKIITAIGNLTLFMLCLTLFAPNVWAQAKVTPDEARKIAKEAYIFNYPLVMMYRTMYLQAIDTKSKSYSGGFGKWLHQGTSSAKSPGKDKESNWLPAPEGHFWLVLRTYGPGKAILNKTWKVPPVKRVK